MLATQLLVSGFILSHRLQLTSHSIRGNSCHDPPHVGSLQPQRKSAVVVDWDCKLLYSNCRSECHLLANRSGPNQI
jgi:hypothetical protein